MSSLPITIPTFFMIALSAAMVWVVITDASKYIISNTLNAFILVLYVAAAIALPLQDVPFAILAALLMLLAGLGLFALGLMGGGDIKLLVVLSLWTGWGMPTVNFIFLTAIFGGLLVLAVLLLRFFIAPLWVKLRPARNLPRLLTRKQPVPYGVAIAAAFVWLMWTNGIPGLGAPNGANAPSHQQAPLSQ